MAAGADKTIDYDPPGAIGLVDPDARVLIRFADYDPATFPRDSAGSLQDLGALVSKGVTGVTLATPAVVPGAVGQARQFDPHVAFAGLSTRDVTSGASLITRDATIQVILSWNAVNQDLAPGNIITRGLGTAGAELIAYGLQIDLLSAATFTGSLRWLWQDIGGTLRLQTGAPFTNLPGKVTMLTATRRWVSPTSVLLRYYIGDTLIGEVASVDGSIGGGTTGGTQIGTRIIGGADANFLAANIDEIMVLDREMCAEEVENTWLRITKYQPLGTQLFLEMHDPGFPIPNEPDSDARLDIRMTGQALGYAAATIENLRRNFLPGRAYGSTLQQWEEAVAVTPQPLQDIDTRRARVLARLQQRNGVSIPGIAQAIGDLADTAVSNLQYLAFDNTWQDDFTTLSLLRWDLTPTACATAVSGSVRFAPGAGTFAAPMGGWLSAAAAVSRSNEFATYSGEHALAKLTMTTPQNNAEAGVFFANRQTQDHLLLGLRDIGGVFTIVTESFLGGVSQGAVAQATIGANPAAIWLHLYQDEGTATWRAAWSTTSRTTGYTVSPAINHPGMVHWSGPYLRSIGAIGAAVVDVDDFTLRTPNGNRPFVAYVYRDPALGGVPDLAGMESVLQALSHMYTEVHVVTSKVFRCGIDPLGSTPMGAL